jgi:hypothetical protein
MANGQLDISQLAQIDGEPGDLMRRDAAGYWNALQRDFREDMGFPLMVTEAYRTLGTQRTYFFGRYRKSKTKTSLFYEGSYWVKLAGQAAASIPGRSKHGDGLAVDVNVYSFDSAAYKWLAKNAGRYGFGNAQGRADGEPWHWVWGETRPSITPAALITEEIDDMEYIKWSDESKDAFFRDQVLGQRERMGNWKGDQVALGDIVRATEEIAQKILDAVTPGIPKVKTDGVLYETTKWTLWTIQAVAEAVKKLDGVDEAELAKALAPQLAPLISSGLAQVSDADLAKIRADVLGEAAKRLGDAG